MRDCSTRGPKAVSRGSAAVALVGPGVDASHSYERTHRDALDHSAHLLARYLLAD